MRLLTNEQVNKLRQAAPAGWDWYCDPVMQPNGLLRCVLDSGERMVTLYVDVRRYADNETSDEASDGIFIKWLREVLDLEALYALRQRGAHAA